MATDNSAAPKLPPRVRIDISTRTLVKTILLLLGVAFLFEIRNILLLLFVVFILNSAIDPVVDKWEKRGVPRAATAFLILLLVVGVLVLLVALLIPPIAEQLVELARHLPVYYDKFSYEYSQISDTIPPSVIANIQQILSSLGDGLKSGAQSTVGAVSSVFGGLVSFVTVIVMTFYTLAQEKSVKKLAESVFPTREHERVNRVLTRVQEKMGAWVRGQLFLSLIIALLVFIGLATIGVNYALVLAMLAGVMELVPIVGVIIAIVPALMLAFAQKPILALGVLVVYLVVQQLENHLIVPKVMQKAVGLNSVVIITALLVGAHLAGIIGVLLAVPVVTALSIVIGDVMEHRPE